MGRLPLADRMLLGFFRAVSALMLFQGIAVTCAALAVIPFATRADAWRPLLLVGFISSTCVVAGLLLRAIQSRFAKPETTSAPGVTKSWLLGGTLLVALMLSLFAGSGLPALWRDIAAQLSAAGFWDELSGSSQAGGILLLAIILALAVPLLVTAAVVWSLALAAVLLMRLGSRSPALAAVLAMGAVVQTAWAGGGWLAVVVLGQLAGLAAANMAGAPDLEVRQLATQLTSAVTVLSTSASRLFAPTLLVDVWAIALWARTTSAQQGRSVPQAVSLPPSRAVTNRPPFLEPQGAEPGARPAPSGVASRHPRAVHEVLAPGGISLALAGLGIAMLLFAAADRLRARAEYVSSTPAAGTSSATAPRAVRVAFSRALDAASTLSIVYIPIVPSSGDISRDVAGRSRLLEDGRTLEVVPAALGRGLYLARWVAYPESGGVTRIGSLAFGVGAPVPPDDSGGTYALTDRDSGSRGKRYTIAGGVMLLVFAALAWFRPA